MRSHKYGMLTLLILLLVGLAGCAVAPGSVPSVETGVGDRSGTTAGTQTGQSAACPVTTPDIATPPDSDYRDPLPRGEYFVSDDKLIWAMVGQWRIGSQKVLWIKPLGSELVVQGRRLAGDGAPLWASIGDGYVGDFQASWLTFPTSGCWEIEARANESFMQFVLDVPPRSEPTESRSCVHVGDLARPDRTIFVGQVEKSALDTSGRWAWQNVRVKQNLYPYSLNSRTASAGAVFTILQDGEQEPLLVEGVDYVLVIHGDPWRIVCPRQTVATVDYAQEPAGIEPTIPGVSLWSGETVPEIEAEIRLARGK